MVTNKWLALFAFLICTMSSVRAEELYTTVFNVIESTNLEKLLVLSGADGRVYKAPKTDENLRHFNSLIGQVVKLTYKASNKESTITSITLAKASEVDPAVMDLNHFQYNELRKFAPTDLQTLKAATEVFDGMLNAGDRKRSQCFKRAHMWSFDMWSKLGISSQKVFLFYTQRFIRLEEKADWWFHVAPMVVVKGEEYVLDGTFMEKPVTVREWQNFFIKAEKITCPVVPNYADISKNQWSRLCYLMKVPMYYFSPLDIEERDLKNVPRNHWEIDELQDSRRAFKNYDTAYEGLNTGKPTITH